VLLVLFSCCVRCVSIQGFTDARVYEYKPGIFLLLLYVINMSLRSAVTKSALATQHSWYLAYYIEGYRCHSYVWCGNFASL